MSFNNHNIPWSKNVKYLGVDLNELLTLLTHIKETIRKATKVRPMLYPVLNSPITIATNLSIFQMYVRSIITYAASERGPLFHVQIGQYWRVSKTSPSFLRL